MIGFLCVRSLVGEWLSLVEHLVRDQGVGGSNPLSPTKSFQAVERYFWFSVYIDGVEIVDGCVFLDLPPGFHLICKVIFLRESRVNPPEQPIHTFPVNYAKGSGGLTADHSSCRTMVLRGSVPRGNRPKIKKIHPLIVMGGQRFFQKSDSLAYCRVQAGILVTARAP